MTDEKLLELLLNICALQRSGKKQEASELTKNIAIPQLVTNIFEEIYGEHSSETALAIEGYKGSLLLLCTVIYMIKKTKKSLELNIEVSNAYMDITSIIQNLGEHHDIVQMINAERFLIRVEILNLPDTPENQKQRNQFISISQQTDEALKHTSEILRYR